MEYPVLDMKATGARIKELRTDHNLKVREVAEFMGLESEQAVYKWQRGESLPTVDNLYALSYLFDTSVDDILRGEKERDDDPSLSFVKFLNFIYLHVVLFSFFLLDQQKNSNKLAWIARLMQQFPFEVTYFAKRSNPLDASMEIPDKALLFNYIIFDEEADEASCIQDIYHLNNGYNVRYAMGVDFETHLVKPFEKAYFCATAQGCGYYAIPNASNRYFYLHTKRNRVMMDYFILDILVLYQTYTVLRFTNVMEHELAAESARYLTESADTLTKLKRLSTEINVFLVKSVYSSVSHISHHNEFYDYLIRKYRVRENIEGLTIGLESLQRLQESREQERLEEIEQKKAKESEQSDNRLNIGLGLISILALISAIADGDAAFELIINLLHLPQSMKTVFDWGLLVLVIGVAIVAIKSVGKYIEQTKKK